MAGRKCYISVFCASDTYFYTEKVTRVVRAGGDAARAAKQGQACKGEVVRLLSETVVFRLAADREQCCHL
ncbi:hypothetical protein D3C85_481920 [compost metagenome]